MSKLVRISDEIFKIIQKDAIPLEDTVDSVLRKWVVKLGKSKSTEQPRTTRSYKGNLTGEKQLLLPVAKAINDKGGEAQAKEVVKLVMARINPTPDDLRLLKDNQPKVVKQIHFARNTLADWGYISREVPKGVWKITKSGYNWLESQLKQENKI